MRLIFLPRRRRPAGRNMEGTGLGLSIAKKLTDRMGGTIRIESKEGTGTTVIMTIPFKIGEAEKARKLEDFVKDPNTISLEGLRALVVEDNELNMEIASFMLEDNGDNCGLRQRRTGGNWEI